MAKIITDTEIEDMVKRIISGKEIDDLEQYQRFILGLAELITDHCGGTSGTVAFDDDIGVSCAFHISEEVPCDGGIFAKYDTDVIWKDGEEADL